MWDENYPNTVEVWDNFDPHFTGHVGFKLIHFSKMGPRVPLLT